MTGEKRNLPLPPTGEEAARQTADVKEKVVGATVACFCVVTFSCYCEVRPLESFKYLQFHFGLKLFMSNIYYCLFKKTILFIQCVAVLLKLDVLNVPPPCSLSADNDSK